MSQWSEGMETLVCNLCQWGTLRALSYLFIHFSLGVPQVTLVLSETYSVDSEALLIWGSILVAQVIFLVMSDAGYLSIYQGLLQGFFWLLLKPNPGHPIGSTCYYNATFSHCTGPLCGAQPVGHDPWRIKRSFHRDHLRPWEISDITLWFNSNKITFMKKQ